MILVDTNVISDAPSARYPTGASWTGWTRRPSRRSFSPAITVAELRFGVAVLPAGKRRDRLAARLEQEVLPLFADLILPFDLAAKSEFLPR